MASTMGTTEVTPQHRLRQPKLNEKGAGAARHLIRTGSTSTPAAIIFIIFFLVPTLVSLYFSFTRWDLFTSTWIGLDNYVPVLQRTGADHRAAQHVDLCHHDVWAQGCSLAWLLALLLTSKIIARGYLRSVIFFPVLVSTVGVGLTFGVLMNPTNGPHQQRAGNRWGNGAGLADQPEFGDLLHSPG